MEKKSPLRQKAIADVSAATIEYIRGMSIIKSYNQEGAATRVYENACKAARKVNISLEKLYILPETLHRAALYLGNCAILYAVSIFMANGNITIDMWIMLALHSFVMFNSIEKVNNATIVFGIVNTTLDNLVKISFAELVDENGQKNALTNFDVELKDVHFAYEQKEIIRGI